MIGIDSKPVNLTILAIDDKSSPPETDRKKTHIPTKNPDFGEKPRMRRKKPSLGQKTQI